MRAAARRRGWLAAALWVALGVLAAMAGARHGVRLDLTADGRHGIAPETRALIDAIDDPVEALAFVPSDAPPPFDRVVRALQDLLEDYARASGGKLRVTVRADGGADASPADRHALRAEALGLGLKPVDLQAWEADRRIVRRAYLGVVLLHGDHRVVVPGGERPEDLPHAMTRGLRDVLDGRHRPLVGVAHGHGEPALVDSPVAALLRTGADLEAVEIGVDPLPARLDALLIVAPRRPFDARACYVIDQFVMQGRAVVMLLDTVERAPSFPDVLVPVGTGLEPLLGGYGVRVSPDRLALDRAHAGPAVVGRDPAGRTLTVDHPLHLVTGVLADHPVTRGLRRLVMPLAAPIDAREAAARGATVTPLVRGESTAVARRGLRRFDPRAARDPVPADEESGPIDLAVAIEGRLTSAFADRTIPGDSLPGARTVASVPARLVIAGSGARFLAAQADALLFLQNAVDWAVDDASLSGLRGRSAEDPPLAPVSARGRAAIKVANIAAPLVLCAVVGLWRRRRRRARDR